MREPTEPTEGRDGSFDKMVAQLQDCRLHDRAVDTFRRCTTDLEKHGATPAQVWAILFQLLEEYAAGISAPKWANAMLVVLDKQQVDRDVLVEVLQAAGLENGTSDPRKGLKDRLVRTRRFAPTAGGGAVREFRGVGLACDVLIVGA